MIKFILCLREVPIYNLYFNHQNIIFNRIALHYDICLKNVTNVIFTNVMKINKIILRWKVWKKSDSISCKYVLSFVFLYQCLFL